MRQKAGELLPDYGRCYFGHVLAEYKTLRLSAPLPPSIEEVLERYSKNPDSMTWSDLYVIEKGLLAVQPFAVIKRRAWALRDKYREVAGPLEYNAYIASHPPNEMEPEISPDEVRADLDRVLGALHWNYSLIPLREGLRAGAIDRIGLGILVTGVLITLVAWLCLTRGQMPLATLIVVAFAGSVGGFVSMQRRIGQIPRDGDPLLSIFQLNSGLSTLYLAPVSGAVFATLLFFIFLGHLVDGSLFPNMELVSKFHWGIGEWTGKGPVVSFAILLVWSFIAGFAERFVPDILDRLISRGQDSIQPTPSPAPPFAGQKTSSEARSALPASSSEHFWYPPALPPKGKQGSGQKEGGPAPDK